MQQAMLEFARIVDQYVLPGKGIGGDQPRQPEAHAGDAQHGRPQFGLGRSKGTQCGVGTEQSLGAVRIETAIGFRAPVIQGDRQVVEHRAGTGVVEVDHAGQVIAVEQHIVAEQVGVDVGPWQREDARLECVDFR
ncbi:hypothetical protein D3C72_2072910 [compost metagenome]